MILFDSTVEWIDHLPSHKRDVYFGIHDKIQEGMIDLKIDALAAILMQVSWKEIETRVQKRDTIQMGCKSAPRGLNF